MGNKLVSAVTGAVELTASLDQLALVAVDQAATQLPRTVLGVSLEPLYDNTSVTAIYPVQRKTYQAFLSDAAGADVRGQYKIDTNEARVNVIAFMQTLESASGGTPDFDFTLGVMRGNWFYSPIPELHVCLWCTKRATALPCESTLFMCGRTLNQLISLDIGCLQRNSINPLAYIQFIAAVKNCSQLFIIKAEILKGTRATGPISIGHLAMFSYDNEDDLVAKVTFWYYERSANTVHVVQEAIQLHGQSMTHAVLVKF